VDSYVERLQTQFAAMEAVLAKNKAIQDYLNNLTTTTKSYGGTTVDTNA
jgi:hypothetical protein